MTVLCVQRYQKNLAVYFNGEFRSFESRYNHRSLVDYHMGVIREHCANTGKAITVLNDQQ